MFALLALFLAFLVGEEHFIWRNVFLTFAVDLLTSLWSDLQASRGRLELVLALRRFVSQRRRAVGFKDALPLAVKRWDKVHQCKSRSHLLDLLLVAPVALADDVAIELERSVEPHLWVINDFLLDELELSDALVAVLGDARQQSHFIPVGASDFFELSVHD